MFSCYAFTKPGLSTACNTPDSKNMSGLHVLHVTCADVIVISETWLSKAIQDRDVAVHGLIFVVQTVQEKWVVWLYMLNPVLPHKSCSLHLCLCSLKV